MRPASKNQLAANRLTGVDDVRLLPMFQAGTIYDGQELGVFQSPNDQVIVGFQVDYQTPCDNRYNKVSFQAMSSDGLTLVPAASTPLVLLGIATSGRITFNAVEAPTGSRWKVVASVYAGSSAAVALPQGVTLTWWLRPALGPSYSTRWSASRPSDGSQEWMTGQTTQS